MQFYYYSFLTTENVCFFFFFLSNKNSLFRGFRAAWSTIMLRLAFSDEKNAVVFCFAVFFLLYSKIFSYVDSFTMNIQKMICVWILESSLSHVYYIFFFFFSFNIFKYPRTKRCRGTGTVFYYCIKTSRCLCINKVALFIFAHLQDFGVDVHTEKKFWETVWCGLRN